MKAPLGVGVAAGETPSLTGEVVGETHRGLECAQAHLLGNQHQGGEDSRGCGGTETGGVWDKWRRQSEH